MANTSSIPPNLVPFQNGVLPFCAGSSGQSQGQYVNVQTGQFTANSTTAVTVAATGITANSLIFIAAVTPAGTPSQPYVFAITPGTGFQIKAGASDTGLYAWIAFG